MMPLPPFELHSPGTLDGALELKGELGAGAKILAGGTDLLVSMKHGLFRPGHLLWLGNVPDMASVTRTGDGMIRMGSMCTLDAIMRDPVIAGHLAPVAGAVRGIASPQIRNRATLGGNLCINTRCFYYDHSEFWRGALCGCLKLGLDPAQANLVCHAGPGLGMCTAVFFSDLAPLLIALDASVEIRNSARSRSIPLSRLYGTDGGAHLTIGDDEIMTAVLVPDPGKDARFRQMKFSLRDAIDFPVANVGVMLNVDPSGACTGARVVVGAVQTRPAEVREAGEMLEGISPGPDTVEEAARAAAAAVAPFPNAYESIAYRKKIVEVLVRRSLRELLSRD